MLELAVQSRDKKENPDALRAQGLIPAVFYGRKEASTPIAIDGKTFEKIWQDAGETTIVTLTEAGGNKEALIHAVDIHPVSGAIVHADLYVIEAGKKLHVAVPIEFVGVAPAEKVGGVISKALHEIEIEVAANELPQHFEVDLSTLENIGDHITVADIAMPKSAELKVEAHEIVVSVIEAQEEPEEEVPAPAEGEEAPAAPEASEGGSTE